MKIERTIDRESKLKLYVQIHSILTDKIESGEWSVGSQIPTEDELCKTYEVSKVTVREAIQELVREGYLKRQQGKGTFVLYSVPQLGFMMRTRLTDIIDGEGVTQQKKIVEQGIMEPSEDTKLTLQTEEKIYRVLRGKNLNVDLPVLEEISIPLSAIDSVEDEDILHKSFLAVIEEKGRKKISRVVQTVEVMRPEGKIRRYFSAEEGDSIVMMERVFFSSDGSPIACSRCFLGLGNKVRMEFERIK